MSKILSSKHSLRSFTICNWFFELQWFSKDRIIGVGFEFLDALTICLRTYLKVTADVRV